MASPASARAAAADAITTWWAASSNEDAKREYDAACCVRERTWSLRATRSVSSFDIMPASCSGVSPGRAIGDAERKRSEPARQDS